MPFLDLSPEELREMFVEATSPSSTEDTDGFYTTEELVRNSGKSKQLILAMLKDCHAQNFLECKQVRRTNITGRLSSKPAYRLKEPPKPEKKRGNRTA